MSAIRRVPPGVVGNIILFAIEGKHSCTRGKEHLWFLQLRSVCQLWQTTSFSTPLLWRDVEIDLRAVVGYDNFGGTAKAWMWRCLAPWFSRAGEGAPLQLEVRGSTTAEAEDVLEFVHQTSYNVVKLAFTLIPIVYSWS
ncbi:hypothetical protein BKA70DRAFT_1426835 [Coprinopsis sp. MPI-PUGE-AT-0042]|nr:hypothetical protein BKA70DRAFT_1426835 [Coprinopsis sp. MPI-PUGE-AT-0042]